MGPAGTRTLVKRATTVDGRARLSVEAAVLRALAHPGIVRVVGLVEDEAATELHLAWVGPDCLGVQHQVPPATAAELVGAVADIVADIHDVGLAHGRIGPEHVLLGPDGSPVLTGLADVTRADRGRVARDVADLGGLVPFLVDRPGDRRRAGSEGPATGDAARRRALLACAAQTLEQAADPDARPSAREVAAALRALLVVDVEDLVPTARVLTAPAPPVDMLDDAVPTDQPGRARGGRWVVVAGLGLCVGATALVGPLTEHDPADEGRERTVPALAPSPTSTSSTPASPSPSRPVAAAAGPPGPTPSSGPSAPAPSSAPIPSSAPTPPSPPAPPPSPPAPPPSHPAPPSASPSAPNLSSAPSPSAAPAVAQWRTAPGEHMWGIARSTLTRAWGREPRAIEVAEYWVDLLEANRDRFVDPAAPDLVLPGQVWTLPEPPPPGVAPARTVDRLAP